MAHRIAPGAAQIKRHFCHLLPGHVIIDACRKASHRWRERKFDPVITIHLFILHILHGNTAILHLRHLVRSPVNAAAYCRARMRLPLAVYLTLLDYTAQLASEGCKPVFAAMRVFLVDGNRLNNAGALQMAIWQLLGEVGGVRSTDTILVERLPD